MHIIAVKQTNTIRDKKKHIVGQGRRRKSVRTSDEEERRAGTETWATAKEGKHTLISTIC